MEETWYSFPARLGEHQGFIACNYSFSEIADNDKRNNHLVVRLAFKQPDEHGLPTPEEFPVLKTIDEQLDRTIRSCGGIYVGRITVDRHRYFHYYVDFSEDKAMQFVQQVATEADYELQYILEQDSEKNNYWEELYPTIDDWQIIRDLKVLDALTENGDDENIKREVLHWAIFENEETATEFSCWVEQNKYRLKSMEQDEDDNIYTVHFTHTGSMVLGDITTHSKTINRKVTELDGEYDGWETSVEKTGLDKSH